MKPDLDAIRARDALVRFMDYATAGDIDRRAMLAYVDELREAAGRGRALDSSHGG